MKHLGIPIIKPLELHINNIHKLYKVSNQITCRLVHVTLQLFLLSIWTPVPVTLTHKTMYVRAIYIMPTHLHKSLS